MEKEDTSLPSIIVPGPEVREKIDKFAGRLSTREKRDADEMVAKVLASPKRDAFAFLDSSHVFYPYFLSKLSEYRQHPERAPESKEAKAAAAAAAAAAPASTSGAAGSGAANTGTAGAPGSSTTTIRANGVVRTEGGTGVLHSDPKREELLRQTELEARRYQKDPFPNRYSLNLKAGTVEVPALLMDVITTTAQYTAKYGEPFLTAVQARQKSNPTFNFLRTNDVRHLVFKGLVASYERILASDPDSTETRLENLQSTEYVLGTVCAEKTKYAQAALARRKAALLTDDELRAKLHWSTFKIIKTFTLSDLMLDGPMPERRAAAAAAPTPASASVTTDKAKPETEHPSASAASTTDGKPAAPSAPAATAGSGGSNAAPATVNTIQPPGGAPTFTPVFMSSSLVASTTDSTGGSGRRQDGGKHGKNAQGGGGIEVVEDYTPQAVAPVRRGVDYFVDAETGEKLRAEDVASGGGVGGANTQAGELKRERESYGLASEDEMARELRRRTA